MSYKRSILIGIVIVLGLATVAVILDLPRAMARVLIVRETPVPSDAIVVLLGGERTERAELAWQLFKRNLAPRIVFCRSASLPAWKTIYVHKSVLPWGERYRTFLNSKGVSGEAIDVLSCENAHDTDSELREVEKFARQKGWRSLTLVTSASHSRRVSIIWRRLASSVPARTIGSKDPFLGEWWRTRRGITTVAYEYFAFVKEFLRRLSPF